MKKYSFYCLLMFCLAFSVVSCNKDDDDNNNDDISNMSNASGEILSTGWQYTSAIAQRSTLNSGNFRITLFSDESISDVCSHKASGGYIELDVAQEIGEYSIGLISTTVYAYKTPDDDYIQPVSGKIVITEITDTTVSGYFETSYENDEGVTELDVSGKFTAQIRGSLDDPSFIDQELQGTIDDKTDWQYSSAIIEMNGSDAYNITINGNDADYSIELKYVPAAVGTYTPGYSNGCFTIDIICPSKPYGKTFAGESYGSLEIVSINDSRVTAKLWLNDSTDGLMDVNGNFTATLAR